MADLHERDNLLDKRQASTRLHARSNGTEGQEDVHSLDEKQASTRLHARRNGTEGQEEIKLQDEKQASTRLHVRRNGTEGQEDINSLDERQASTRLHVRTSRAEGQDEVKMSRPQLRKQLILLWFVHASQGFQTTMLFPMLVFMVQKYGVPAKQTGKYAGFLASLVPLAQFCSSFFWGKISDRTGRKTWLIFGNVVAAVCSILLGLCKTYPAACVVRFSAGLLNGSVTLTKSILSELCDGPNRAKGFAVFNLAWGIGSIIGPVLAGLLAQPCKQYKIKQCSPFLLEYPFLLPCIAAFLFCSSSALASLQLIETSPQRKKAISNKTNCKCAEMLPLQSQVNQDSPSPGQGIVQMGHTLDVDDKAIMIIETASMAVENKKHENHINALDMQEGKEKLRHTKAADKKPKSIFRDPNVLITTLCYSMTGLIFIITDELFPLFGAASKELGGLGMNSSTLGLILGEGGVILFIYTLVIYPKVVAWCGPLHLFRIGLLATVPTCIMFPATSLLPSITFLKTAFLFVAMASKSVADCNAFTSVLILISNSASDENMGAVTGLSHGFCSLFRAVGPALGGLMWSFSVAAAFHFHQFMAWLVIICLGLFTLSLTFLLRRTLDRPKFIPQPESVTSSC